MENIFEGAKFGDKFNTNTNIPALYIRKEGNDHILIAKSGPIMYCGDDGKPSQHRIVHDYIALSIVSRYQESIDEEKLDELTDNYFEGISSYENILFYKAFFKAGYRKAKEE